MMVGVDQGLLEFISQGCGVHETKRLETTARNTYVFIIYFVFTVADFTYCPLLHICSVPCVCLYVQQVLLSSVLLYLRVLSLAACSNSVAFHLLLHINFERENRFRLKTSPDTFVSRQQCPFHYLSRGHF